MTDQPLVANAVPVEAAIAAARPAFDDWEDVAVPEPSPFSAKALPPCITVLRNSEYVGVSTLAYRWMKSLSKGDRLGIRFQKNKATGEMAVAVVDSPPSINVTRNQAFHLRNLRGAFPDAKALDRWMLTLPTDGSNRAIMNKVQGE